MGRLLIALLSAGLLVLAPALPASGLLSPAGPLPLQDSPMPDSTSKGKKEEIPKKPDESAGTAKPDNAQPVASEAAGKAQNQSGDPAAGKAGNTPQGPQAKAAAGPGGLGLQGANEAVNNKNIYISNSTGVHVGPEFHSNAPNATFQQSVGGAPAAPAAAEKVQEKPAADKAQAKPTAIPLPSAKSATMREKDPDDELADGEVPAPASVAFEGALPIGTEPSMYARGDYEYSLYASESPNPDTRKLDSRRVGFFAIKYRGADQPNDQHRLNAAWSGARAVRTELVSFAQPGLGGWRPVEVREGEGLLIGTCSFDDQGRDPRFGWLAIEHRMGLDPLRPWVAFVNQPGQGEYQVPTTDDLANLEIPLLATQELPDAEAPRSSKPDLLTPDIRRRISVQSMTPDLRPRLQAVVAADSVRFSIRLDLRDDRDAPPVSFHLVGRYERAWSFDDTDSYTLTSAEGWQQNGAVIFRGTRHEPDGLEDLARRAAQYGSDVLRRRRETLQDPELLRKQRLGDDRHLALFVRSSRTGETAHVAVLSRGLGPDIVTSGYRNRPVPPPLPVTSPAMSCRPGLVSGCRDCPMPQAPAHAYPLFVEGANGFRLVEAWIVVKRRIDGAFAFAPTPVFDVEYLFQPSR